MNILEELWYDNLIPAEYDFRATEDLRRRMFGIPLREGLRAREFLVG